MRISTVIGSPIAHSLSPAMYNAAYKALKIDLQYHFNAELVQPELLEEFIQKRKNEFHALAVTIPHKETIVHLLDHLSEEASVIGAVNTVLNRNGELTGYNTDSPGAIEALKQVTKIGDKSVAVLGSGGTARAIVYGLIKEGASVTVFSRNKEKADLMVKNFGSTASNWEDRDRAVEYEIIINTTPVGRENEPPPIPTTGIGSGHIVFDVNYNRQGTRLLQESKWRGAMVIDGLELLLRQGLIQFELMTGLKAPEEVMRKALYGN